MSVLRGKAAHMRTSLTLFMLCVLITFSAELYSAQPESFLREFPRAQLIINTSNNRCALFDVYVAQTSAQRSQGLMYIESMGKHEGMIFIYNKSAHISMWMKNTVIPLDMLFIDNNLKVAGMHADAIPHSEEIIQSGKDAFVVIELNAGSIEYFNIKAGNQIVFPAG